MAFDLNPDSNQTARDDRPNENVIVSSDRLPGNRKMAFDLNPDSSQTATGGLPKESVTGSSDHVVPVVLDREDQVGLGSEGRVDRVMEELIWSPSSTSTTSVCL